MKYCPNCGNPVEDNTKFCGSCGAPQETSGPEPQPQPEPAPKVEGEEAGAIPWPNEPSQEAARKEFSNGFNGGSTIIGTQRSIAACIIFSIITCGIYQLYWVCKLNDEINEMAGERDYRSGGMVILFSLITCGIYALVWNYRMGKLVDKMSNKGDNSVLYLILSIFGFGIISCCLMQDAINSTIVNS